MNRKVVTVSEVDVALFVARKVQESEGKRRKRYRSDRKVKPADPPDVISEWFLQNFSSQNLLQALQTKAGKPITLAWIVQRMLDILDDEESKAAERMAVLDRLRDLLLLGSIQDPELSEEVQCRIAGGKPSPGKAQYDPFSGEKGKKKNFKFRPRKEA